MSTPRVIDMLLVIADPTTDARTKIITIDLMLDRTGHNVDVYGTLWRTVEMVMEDVQKQTSRQPDARRELARLCKKHKFQLQPHVEAKDIPYSDRQSVHLFMQDTHGCLEWLIENHEPTPFVRPFEHRFFDRVESSFTPIYRDHTLYDILARVMDYIEQSEHRDELLKIMRAEMDEAADTCVSGHLSAVVNCLYGFPGVPDIVGSTFEHEKSQVFHYLNTHLDLFDIDGLNESIAGFFVEGRLPVTNHTLRILEAYTGERWLEGSLKQSSA